MIIYEEVIEVIDLNIGGYLSYVGFKIFFYFDSV